ncbi:MAG: PDZ domain-containing protein [Rubrobacteraceae bacterium]|nr:PDZ domain-containing protein [Rubrobacteraceae bacterium]
MAAGTYYVNEAWRETAPSSGETARGFLLLPPRSGSPLSLTDAQGGDRLLEVDDQPVESIAEIQTAIRKHSLGEEVRVLVQRGSDSPRVIRARHVSDLPST